MKLRGKLLPGMSIVWSSAQQTKKRKKRREKAGREGEETEGYVLTTQSVCSGTVAEAESRESTAGGWEEKTSLSRGEDECCLCTETQWCKARTKQSKTKNLNVNILTTATLYAFVWLGWQTTQVTLFSLILFMSSHQWSIILVLLPLQQVTFSE